MGNWRVRALGVLLVTVLGGAPAAAMACEALCAHMPAGAHTSDAANGQSHHHSAASGHHHGSGSAAAVPTSQAQINGRPGHECCDDLGRPRVSLTASRADAGVLSTPPVAVLPSDVLSAPPDGQPARARHAPPPDALSSTRTPLVLRI